MKLMDKFHSPKIKRTPSKKGKQLQPEPAAKSAEKPANKVCVCVCVFRWQKVYVCVLWEMHLVPTFFPQRRFAFFFLQGDWFPV